MVIDIITTVSGHSPNVLTVDWIISDYSLSNFKYFEVFLKHFQDVSASKIEVSANDFEGTWYGYFGTHADYDCVDCKQFEFTIEDGQVVYDAKYRLGLVYLLTNGCFLKVTKTK